jgi:RAQPRD family integrative conjugative element protein
MRVSTILQILLALLTSASLNTKAAEGERAELQLLVNLLNQSKQIIARGELSASEVINPRYRLDYMRLRQDVDRVRDGIEHYLSPSRAQPSDPSELIGDYTTEPARESSP